MHSRTSKNYSTCEPKEMSQTTKETTINQCDGCRRGLPVNAHNIHEGEGFWAGDMQACTKDRYLVPLLAAQTPAEVAAVFEVD